jgi:hypothetical protein
LRGRVGEAHADAFALGTEMLVYAHMRSTMPRDATV